MKKRKRYDKLIFAGIIAVGLVLGIIAKIGLVIIDKKEGRTSKTEELTLLEPNDTSEFTTEASETVNVKHPGTFTITVTATGDCTLANTQDQSYEDSFNAYYDSKGEDYFLSGVREVFEADDLTLINLECVLSESTDRVEKTFNLEGKPEYVGILTGSSVEACSLGNNHSQDYGPQSLTDTEDVLDEAGIVYGFNDHIGYYTTEDGLVVAVLSANLLNEDSEHEDYLLNGITTAKEEGADLVICCCHWGVEKQYYPTDYQTSMAHKLVDAGADLVIGNHPHVLEGVELYNGKVICYSLGNFCFGGNKNPTDKNTMMYQQTFTFTNDVLSTDIDAKIIPCRLSGSSSYNDFCPQIAESSKQSIIDLVNEYSAPYSSISFDDDGNLLTGDTDSTSITDDSADESTSTDQAASSDAASSSGTSSSSSTSSSAKSSSSGTSSSTKSSSSGTSSSTKSSSTGKSSSETSSSTGKSSSEASSSAESSTTGDESTASGESSSTGESTGSGESTSGGESTGSGESTSGGESSSGESTSSGESSSTGESTGETGGTN